MRLVAVDVRMVQLDTRQHRCPWPVVKEFRPFVEIGGVVLIPLDNDVLATAEPEADAAILGDAADEKRGVEPRGDKKVGEESRRRRLPVRPRHHHRVPASEETTTRKAAGKLICGSPRSRAAVASGLTRRMTLPTTTRSGFTASRFSGR